MWLKLNLDGIVLSLRIRQYKKVEADDWDSTWCKTDFSFISESWLKYIKEDDEVLLAREVDELLEALEKLLTDQLHEPTEFTCIEPDFIFELNPKEDLRKNPRYLYIRPGCEIADIDLEWKVFFWHEGLTGNYLSVALARPDIECLRTYLKVVTGQLSENDAEVQSLIAKGILY